MKNMRVAVLLACAAVLLTVPYAFGDQGKGYNAGSIVQGLGLSDEQQAKITAGEQALEKELLPLKQAIQGYRTEINRELSSENPDKTRINILLEKVSGKMTEIQQKKISNMLWIRQQLTPEQKQKLKNFLQKDYEGAQGK